ncbi:hypothetical protein HNQ92_000760 [Rhabdobacter roseus]|uniref:DUF4105 domain-containing protein n=1 Tax=Rhabdobacter roseus TaxID=1655419 RepID=A0A840TSG1_9BACT|nr:DUF4105 domain-containing protein [Rhabdobacter roseus]MBB5282639.1 hypothetical protein [Rhabdobacter roseus]
MKKGIVAVFLLLALSTSAQIPLSDRAEISVITCGPYQGELYSAFGHSAIRVHDPEAGVDLAYNYGVFQFNSAFYLNFTRGHLLYNLGVYPYDRFRDFYISQNRYVHEQLLNLRAEQKQKVADYLYHNAQPENATYRYDYFYNNCATKVRDVFVVLFRDSLKFDGTYVTTSYSLRDLTDIYLAQQPWGDLGIDICLGLPMDKKITPFEYMFLPDYVESGFDHATLNGVALVKEKKVIYEAAPETVSFRWFHPWLVFGLFLLFTLVLSYSDWQKKKLTKWFDVALFSIAGWVGVLLLFLWTATDHRAAANNFNLLWAFPLHALAAIFLLRKQFYPLLSNYFRVFGILSVATLLLWFVLPQRLNVYLIPFVVALGVRAFTMAKLLAVKRR